MELETRDRTTTNSLKGVPCVLATESRYHFADVAIRGFECRIPKFWSWGTERLYIRVLGQFCRKADGIWRGWGTNHHIESFPRFRRCCTFCWFDIIHTKRYPLQPCCLPVMRFKRYAVPASFRYVMSHPYRRIRSNENLRSTPT